MIKSGGDIIINTVEAEAYILDKLFAKIDMESDIKSAVAYEYGDAIRTIGIFNMRFITLEGDDRTKYPLRTFSYPNVIETYPTSVSIKTMSLDDDIEPVKYRILHYSKGDIMMSATSKQDSNNCEMFLNFLTRGKIPNSIPYSKIVEIWNDNFAINGLSSGVPATIMQCIIAEMCRYNKDPVKQFRKMIGKGGVSEHDYITANMRSIASYTSVFNAMTFENFGEMMTTSVNMSRNDVKQSRSPIEKILQF